MTRLRAALALVIVAGGLLAAAALWKQQTCGCSGGLPFGAISAWSGAAAAVALAAYVATGALRSGR